MAVETRRVGGVCPGLYGSDGSPLAHFRPCEHPYAIQLAEPPGQTYVYDSSRYRDTAAGDGTFVQHITADGLTQAEKKWLKVHYVNEFRFLRSYKLSIYQEEDRAEGRAILRGLARVDS